ncbi:MAG: DUF5677 domain-containing protein [Actinomycetes bacterium]
MRQPTERTGPLVGHVRKGGICRTPLAATGLLNIADWVRDDLPDLMWPVLYLEHRDRTHAAVDFVRWQEDVINDLADLCDDRQFLADCLDGRLTGLDRLVAQVPEAKEIVSRRAHERDLLPMPVISTLSLYPNRPADWLTNQEPALSEAADLNLLAKAVTNAVGDGHREAILKCLFIWARVATRTFSSDEETVELLKTYPTDADTRSKADTVVRASWGANRGARLWRDENAYESSLEWARTFWDFNSMTTMCIRKRELESRKRGEGRPDDAESETMQDGGSQNEPLELDTFAVVEAERPSWLSEAPETAGVLPKDLRRRAMDMMGSYTEAIEESRPFRLFEPEPQEVHAGLVSRAAREVITALGSPDLWCSEHGSHVSRVIVEARIVLAWMSQQDSGVYRQYKEYGAGKAKLYSLIAEEVPTEWLIDGATEAIDKIRDASHNDDILDFVVVDTRSTFAEGMSLREMADEAGLLDLYRQTYQLQSGIAHSEWWSVEIHAMEQCLNILHRGHLIPNLALSYGGNVEYARSWVIALYGLMQMSLSILGTSREAVDGAFSWLTQPEEAGAGGRDEGAGTAEENPA